jgi:hypothetical protein
VYDVDRSGCFICRYQHLGEMMTLGAKDGTVTLNLPGGLTLEGPLGNIGEVLVTRASS